MHPEPTPLDTSRLAPRPTAGETPPTPPSAPAASAPPAEPAAPTVELTPDQVQEIEEKILAALRTCFDPEIPVNIYELGLIYSVDVSPTGAVHVRMTLTSPACPAAGSLPPEVETKVRAVPGVTAAKVEVVWEPPWDKDMMSEAARLELGLFD